MRVSWVISEKGSTVATISPLATVAEAANHLRLHGVGALVVSQDGRGILGVISERDLVRALAERGGHILHECVTDLMTSDVVTCKPEDSLEQVMAMMTNRRIRHVPVVVEGVLCGIVSIGDVVKWRLTELEDETRQLHSYISTGR
ncbi:MAG: CBS domain-containing protein [Microthrixaceae bacterium]